MNRLRIALANLRYPARPEEAVVLAVQAIEDAATQSVQIICFPECYVPGYRGCGKQPPPPDPAFLERAWKSVAAAAGRAGVAVVLGTERVVDGALRATALVIDCDGSVLGWQDKVQLDPSEDETYSPGFERQVFRTGALTFGVVICHEGWRYPETVRYAARRGAQVVFHPHLHVSEGGFVPESFADPRNTFHEKAALCRAAENTCYFASVNYASAGSPTTSVVVRPDGSVQCWQPYGVEGLLVAEVELESATGLLAARCKSAG